MNLNINFYSTNMIRKSIILLLVSLFIPWVGHGKNMISTAKKAETTQQQLHFMTAKQWEKVHAAYALKTYQPKDCWNFITDYSPNDKANQATTRLFQNMKIQLSGDSLLYLNGRKLRVKRAECSLQTMNKQSSCFNFLYKYLTYRGLQFSKTMPVLQLKASKHDLYSDKLQYVYTGDYLTLYHKGSIAIYKYIRQKDQGKPDAKAKLVYTMADMYKDFEKEGSSERAKTYHIRQWKEPLKMASFDRIEDMPVDGGFFFEKLPDFNGFPIFVCYNYNEDDEFLIYVMKHGVIDFDYCLQVDAFSSYNDTKEDFAIFSDGTIYIQTTKGKKAKILVFRINKQGDFYMLK